MQTVLHIRFSSSRMRSDLRILLSDDEKKPYNSQFSCAGITIVYEKSHRVERPRYRCIYKGLKARKLYQGTIFLPSLQLSSYGIKLFEIRNSLNIFETLAFDLDLLLLIIQCSKSSHFMKPQDLTDLLTTCTHSVAVGENVVLVMN